MCPSQHRLVRLPAVQTGRVSRTRPVWGQCASLALLAAVLSLLVGCGRPAPPTPGLVRVLLPTATAAPVPTSPEAAALLTVSAEAESVRQQDVDALAALWLPNGSATDASHTPGDDGDDVSWQGWEAVRGRYVNDVFPYVSEPTVAFRPRVIVPVVSVTGDEAEVLVPGSDGRTPQDRWLLRRVDGAWRIVSLTFNLAPTS